GVPVDPTSALPAAGFPIVNGTVLAAVSDGAGGWYIGGQFTSVGGSARSNLAHVLAGGSISPWDPGAHGLVRPLVLRGGLVLGGAPRNGIGAVDAATGVATSWNADANGSVRALAAGTAALYVGGQFTTIGGLARGRIAAVDWTTGAVDPVWDPGANSLVLALA